MRRRRFLTGGGLVVFFSLAGCLEDDPQEQETTPTPDPTPGPPVAPEDDEFPMEYHGDPRGGGEYALQILDTSEEDVQDGFQYACANRDDVMTGLYDFMEEELEGVSIGVETTTDAPLFLHVELGETDYTEEEIINKTPPTVIAVDEDGEEICRTPVYVHFTE